MRKATRGDVRLDLALAMSHEPESGSTCGLLLGCSDMQQTFMLQEIRDCNMFACHPLMLPVLITEYHRQILRKQAQRLWTRLLGIESSSGQTGAQIAQMIPFVVDKNDYDALIKGALELIQFSASWENYTHALLLGAETIQKSIDHLSLMSHCQNKAYMSTMADILTERLTFISHRAKIMGWDLQYINKRGQAQMTAVSSWSVSSTNLLLTLSLDI